MAARFVAHVLLGAALLLAAAGAFNYAIDPYQQYRIPTRHEPRFYAAFQRFENPGIARHYDFDRAIIGSSMTENLAGSEVDAAFEGGRTMNLSLSAMTAWDARQLLEVALRRGTLRQVLYNLDFNAFSGAVDRTGFPEPLPLYLYDEAIWNDYPYLLSAATLRKSAEIVAGRRVNRFSTDPDRPWYWAGAATFSARRAVEGLDPADINRRFRQPPRTLEGMRASFTANVLAVVRAHPRVEFVFVYPPYSALVWADFRQRAQLEITLAFKRELFEALAPLPNVRIFDFQAERPVVENLDLYSDIYHFSPEVGRAILAAVAAGANRVTRENLESGIRELRRLAEDTDPARVIASARTRPPSAP